MNVVMTRGEDKSKKTYIQFRCTDKFKEEVELTAEARGLSVSALIYSLLSKAVRQEKDQYPHIFLTAVKPISGVMARKEDLEIGSTDKIAARIGSDPTPPTRENIQEMLDLDEPIEAPKPQKRRAR